MAGIFTRGALDKIMNNADLTPEQRTEQIFSLYQRERPQQFKIRCNRPYCSYDCVVVARTREKATAKWNKNAERFTQAEWKKVVG